MLVSTESGMLLNDVFLSGFGKSTHLKHFKKTGHGTPLGSIDKSCFNWKRCLQCVDIDSQGDCFGSSTSYIADLHTQAG